MAEMIPSSLDVKIQIQSWRAPVRVVRLEGHLDPNTAPDLSKTVNQLRMEEPLNWAFQLAGLEYISSAGVAVLLALEDRVQENHGSICFFELSPAVTKVFDTLNLNSQLKIFASEAEAKNTFPFVAP